MLPVMEPMRDQEFDCLTFMPDQNDNVKIEAGKLTEPGDTLGGSKMGCSYEIVLFKDGEEGPTHLDHFIAILGCPLEYASFLIPAGWYGLITKWTTTSKEITEPLVEKIRAHA